MASLPKPREAPTKINTFTADEIAAIMDVAKSNPNPLRDTAIITMLLDTGIRIGEAMSLHLSDVKWKEGVLDLRGKTGERSVPFGRKTKAAVKRYIDHERDAFSHTVRSVFLTMDGKPMTSRCATRHLCRLARSAGLERDKVGPHTYRHTFAVEFIRAGGDAFTLQRLLGHSTLDMTRKYVHLVGSDLRAAHKRFSPGNRLIH